MVVRRRSTIEWVKIIILVWIVRVHSLSQCSWSLIVHIFTFKSIGVCIKEKENKGNI